ncbi:MAG: hypothetical protein R3F11_32790 [Verrucomicrobiales bacterium]
MIHQRQRRASSGGGFDRRRPRGSAAVLDSAEALASANDTDAEACCADRRSRRPLRPQHGTLTLNADGTEGQHDGGSGDG